MDGYSEVGTNQLDKVDALFCVHGDHEQWQRRRRNCGASEMNQHQVDGLAFVMFRNGFEVIDHQRVAGNVDSVKQTVNSQ